MAAIKVKLLTAEELLNMPRDGYRYELIRGALKKIAPVGHTGGYYELLISAKLFEFVNANKLGRAYRSNTSFLSERNSDYALAPDAAFVRRERVEEVGEAPGFFPGAPDFVAEAISPCARLTDVRGKAEEWLNAGTLMVVVVNPRNRAVSVHTPESVVTRVVTLNEGDTLDGGDAAPGWRLPIADIFE